MRSFVSIQREIAEVERAYSFSLSNQRPRPELQMRLAALRRELAYAAAHGKEEVIHQSRLVTDKYPSTSGRPTVRMQSGEVATRNTVTQTKIGGGKLIEVKSMPTVTERDETIRLAGSGTATPMQVEDTKQKIHALRNAHRLQLAAKNYAQASLTLKKLHLLERELKGQEASRGHANAHHAGRRAAPHHAPQMVRPVPQEPQIPAYLSGAARVAYIDTRIKARNEQIAHYRKLALISGLLTPIGGVAAGAYAHAEIVNIGKVQRIRRQLLTARQQAVGVARQTDTRYYAPPVPTSTAVESLPTFATASPGNAQQDLVASVQPGTVSSEFVKGTEGATAATSTEASSEAATPTSAGGFPWMWVGLAAAAAGAAFVAFRKKKPVVVPVRTNRGR